MKEHYFQDFDVAGKQVLDFLYQRFGFGLWMITRVQGDDWIVLQSEDHGYDVEPGMVFRWTDSFCSRMVQGLGPCVAPSSDKVPAYLEAPIGKQVPIKAYIGVPLKNKDGSLFGTLCAIDPAPQPESIMADQPLIELLADMLSRILALQLLAEDEIRRIERLEAKVQMDPLTRLLNRGAWDQLMSREEERCQRYGHSSVVVMMDLNGLKAVNDTNGHAAGDALIVRAAEAIREVTRKGDISARLGGDEFGIIAVECDYAGMEILIERLMAAFGRRDVSVAVGAAIRSASGSLLTTWEAADKQMYQRKKI